MRHRCGRRGQRREAAGEPGIDDAVGGPPADRVGEGLAERPVRQAELVVERVVSTVRALSRRKSSRPDSGSGPRRPPARSLRRASAPDRGRGQEDAPRPATGDLVEERRRLAMDGHARRQAERAPRACVEGEGDGACDVADVDERRAAVRDGAATKQGQQQPAARPDRRIVGSDDRPGMQGDPGQSRGLGLPADDFGLDLAPKIRDRSSPARPAPSTARSRRRALGARARRRRASSCRRPDRRRPCRRHPERSGRGPRSRTSTTRSPRSYRYVAARWTTASIPGAAGPTTRGSAGSPSISSTAAPGHAAAAAGAVADDRADSVSGAIRLTDGGTTEEAGRAGDQDAHGRGGLHTAGPARRVVVQPCRSGQWRRGAAALNLRAASRCRGVPR